MKTWRSPGLASLLTLLSPVVEIHRVLAVAPEEFFSAFIQHCVQYGSELACETCVVSSAPPVLRDSLLRFAYLLAVP